VNKQKIVIGRTYNSGSTRDVNDAKELVGQLVFFHDGDTEARDLFSMGGGPSVSVNFLEAIREGFHTKRGVPYEYITAFTVENLVGNVFSYVERHETEEYLNRVVEYSDDREVWGKGQFDHIDRDIHDEYAFHIKDGGYYSYIRLTNDTFDEPKTTINIDATITMNGKVYVLQEKQ
jgi:uncharacterized protein YlzI (FlbEa/FlbD family)